MEYNDLEYRSDGLIEFEVCNMHNIYTLNIPPISPIPPAPSPHYRYPFKA